jgi:hypothetical protein
MAAPQQVHLTFDSQQYNLGPDRREFIGIIAWLQELYLLLSFSQTKHFANLTSDFPPCPMAFCNVVRKVSN